jgi:hypothetical protein
MRYGQECVMDRDMWTGICDGQECVMDRICGQGYVMYRNVSWTRMCDGKGYVMDRDI